MIFIILAYIFIGLLLALFITFKYEIPLSGWIISILFWPVIMLVIIMEGYLWRDF